MTRTPMQLIEEETARQSDALQAELAAFRAVADAARLVLRAVRPHDSIEALVHGEALDALRAAVAGLERQN